MKIELSLLIEGVSVVLSEPVTFMLVAFVVRRVRS